MRKEFFFKLVENILPYIFIFIAAIYRPIDPDLGWHLKYGEYFFKNFRPLYENTFSTEMPNFLWPNIAWGTDVITYTVFKLGGFFGLTLASALIVSLTFFFFSKATKLTFWDQAFIFPLLLYFLSPINSNSFRGQLIGLMFLGILMYLLNRYEEGKKKSLYLIPILFLFWANLQGLFILGLAIFTIWQGFYLLSKFIKEKQIAVLKSHLTLFIPFTGLSIIATLIHPYGPRIYSDALLHFNDPVLKSILEYLPPEELSQQWFNLFFTAILVFSGGAALFLNSSFKKKIPEIGVFTVLFILSLWVKRYAWAMYYTMIPFLSPLASFIKPTSYKWTFIGATTIFIISIFVVLLIKQPFDQFTGLTWDKYCNVYMGCSANAADALRKYYREGKTMTLYNWGGWMIWNYPDMKPSTDGRMHLWRDETGYSAFEHDYSLEQNIDDVNNSKYDIVFTSKEKPIYIRLMELTESKGWDLVYENETSVIFIRASQRQ